jgi:peptidoglycan/LPS O-acetylase OafA/YrhL
MSESKWQVYGKSLTAAAYAVAVVVVPFWSGDHHIDTDEGVAIAIAVCTAALTYLVPLAPGARWIKTAVGALLAGLQVATTVIIGGGVSGNGWLLIAFAVLGALGITLAPAVSPRTGVRSGVGTTSA